MLARLFLVFCLFGTVFAGTQHVYVTGVVTCNGKPENNLTVRLMEKDWMDKDDLLFSTETDSTGTYELAGKEFEFTAITPYLLIDHQCAPEGKECGTYHATTKVMLKDVVFGNANIDKKSHKADNLELNELPGEKSECTPPLPKVTDSAKEVTGSPSTKTTTTLTPNNDSSTIQELPTASSKPFPPTKLFPKPTATPRAKGTHPPPTEKVTVSYPTVLPTVSFTLGKMSLLAAKEYDVNNPSVLLGGKEPKTMPEETEATDSQAKNIVIGLPPLQNDNVGSDTGKEKKE